MAEDPSQDGPEEDDASEVLSLGMADDGDTGEIEDPEETEPHLIPADADAGFDGWLDGQEGEDTDGGDDPYRELAEHDPESEVSDWLAFARGEQDETGSETVAEEAEEPAEPDAETEPADDDDRHDTSEFDTVVATATDDESEGADDDDTGEVPVVSDFGLEGPPADEDTGEIPVVSGVDDEAAVVDPEWGLDASDPDEPTAEASAEAAASTVDDVDDEDGDEDGEAEASFDTFTEEDYLGAATQEHAELAADIAAAEEDHPAQVPLSAAIPGLETSVVGFDDVVEQDDEEVEVEERRSSSDLALRIGTGIALLVALSLSLLWRPALIVFALAVFVVSAGEFYSALISRRYKPMSLFGFLGITGAALGTAAWGVAAIPIAMVLMATALLLFNAVSPRRDHPATNFSLTVLVAAWIGGLGAFAFDIIGSDDYQVLVIVIVALVALSDIAAFFVGRSIGRRSMSPVISPHKTIEGLVAGTLTALAVGAGAAYLVDSIDLSAGLMLGAVVAVFAPIGDLAVSVVKRDLDVKDMGSILPGHGGLLDRVDALIATIPALWLVMTWLALI